MPSYEYLLRVANENYEHALGSCTDPDCEIHNPGCIEDEASLLNASAWFIAGAQKMADEMHAAGVDLIEDRTDREFFLGGEHKAVD